MAEVLVCGHQQFKACRFCGLEQLTVGQGLPASLIGGLDKMVSQRSFNGLWVWGPPIRPWA